MAPTIRLRAGVNDLLKEHFKCATNGAVAERIGVDASTWSRAIRGRAIPGPKLAEQLLKIEGFTFDDLFEVHTGEPRRDSAA